jgi:uncharacterized protein
MENKTEQYYTLITGASSGIGKAMAIECAQRGMNLLLVSLPESGLIPLSVELSKEHQIKVEYLEINLTNENAHREIHNYIQDKNLLINMLINNVGVGHNGFLENLSEEKVTDMLMLNMRITTLLTQILIPELKKSDNAYILNVGSLAAFSPLPGKSVYAASKAYVLYLTKAISQELKSTSISVSGIFPAGVPTNSAVINRITKSGMIAKYMVLTPKEIANYAISGLLRKENIIIPGRKTKTFFLLGNLLPHGLLMKIMAREFIRSPQ